MERKPDGPWLGTKTGKIISLLNPDPDQIELEDIATGLANVARFNGQTSVWYSVAEHSVHVSELLPNHLKLQGLLHDATEAYICDIPSPLKHLLGDAYRDVERRLAVAIGQKFGVELADLHEQTKKADEIMLFTERDYLQKGGPDWGWGNDTLRYPGFAHRCSLPQSARDFFLKAYEKAVS